MMYLVIIISSILSGMGIGGGSLVIIFLSNFNILNHKEAMIVSLIIFIVSGVSATFFNLKRKIEIKKYFFKIMPFVVIGSLIGSNFGKNIGNDKLKLYFNLFMVIIGIYEIISSLKNIKKGKL